MGIEGMAAAMIGADGVKGAIIGAVVGALLVGGYRRAVQHAQIVSELKVLGDKLDRVLETLEQIRTPHRST